MSIVYLKKRPPWLAIYKDNSLTSQEETHILKGSKIKYKALYKMFLTQFKMIFT